MRKYETNDIFITDNGEILQIVNINEELVRLSVYNKAITVQCLNTGDDINLSYCHLDTWGIKYLGRNEGAAWVLYGSNLKKEINHETPISYSLKSIAKRYHSQND